MRETRGHRRSTSIATVAAALLASSAPALVEQMYIYPQKEQSPEQQASDKAECQEWATQQTGFDPLAPSPAVAAPPQQQGGAVRGAARGAAVGAIAGAIAGDAGKGAAIGAGVGGAGGAIRQHDRSLEAAHENEEQAARVEAQRAEHRRAMSACLEARGYTVK